MSPKSYSLPTLQSYCLEAILLRIMRTHQRLPVEFLVRRLNELEQTLGNGTQTSASAQTEKAITVSMPIAAPAAPTVVNVIKNPLLILQKSEKKNGKNFE